MKKHLIILSLIIFLLSHQVLAESFDEDIFGFAIQEKLVRAEMSETGELNCATKISVDFRENKETDGAVLKEKDAVKLDEVWYCRDSLNIAMLTNVESNKGILINESDTKYLQIKDMDGYKKIKEVLDDFSRQTKDYLGPTQGLHIYTSLNPKPIHLPQIAAKEDNGLIGLAKKFEDLNIGFLRQNCLIINTKEGATFSSELEAGKAGEEAQPKTAYYNLAVFDKNGEPVCSSLGTQSIGLDLKKFFGDKATVKVTRNFVARVRNLPTNLDSESLKKEPFIALTLERSLNEQEFEKEKNNLKNAGLGQEMLELMDYDSGTLVLQSVSKDKPSWYYLFNGTIILNKNGEIIAFDYAAAGIGENYSFGPNVPGRYTFPSGTRMRFGVTKENNNAVIFPNGIPQTKEGEQQSIKACFQQECFTLTTNPNGKITSFKKQNEEWVVEGDGFTITDERSRESITIKSLQEKKVGYVTITTQGFRVGKSTQANFAGATIKTRNDEVLVLHECSQETVDEKQNYILLCRQDQKKGITLNGKCFEIAINDFAAYSLTTTKSNANLNYNLKGADINGKEDCTKGKNKIVIANSEVLLKNGENGRITETNCDQALTFANQKITSEITQQEEEKSTITGAATSAPQQPITIVIDAGHGGDEKGACDNQICEREKNLEISELLASKLDSYGYKTILTRTKEGWHPNIKKYVCNANPKECTCKDGKGKDVVCTSKRGLFSNEMGGVIFISNHNQCKDCDRMVIYPGVSSYGSCGKKSNTCGPNNVRCLESEELAKEVQTSLQTANPTISYSLKDKGPSGRCARYGMLTTNNHPAIIIEYAAINDPDLKDSKKISALVAAAADGINSYIQKNKDSLFIQMGPNQKR
ncbi:N-acetylmuramoyl-L-alanine amidase [Candidatus Woesearchaeota archaeon]|nr:N-acetylmuramoyl-L-alanine amidase [Candidatus Woesearchaeota archaeon]